MNKDKCPILYWLLIIVLTITWMEKASYLAHVERNIYVLIGLTVTTLILIFMAMNHWLAVVLIYLWSLLTIFASITFWLAYSLAPESATVQDVIEQIVSCIFAVTYLGAAQLCFIKDKNKNSKPTPSD